MPVSPLGGPRGATLWGRRKPYNMGLSGVFLRSLFIFRILSLPFGFLLGIVSGCAFGYLGCNFDCWFRAGPKCPLFRWFLNS